MRILVVDDQPFICHTMERQLSRAGLNEVISANSAREAFERLGIDPHADPADEAPIDLVLMDIMMPEINGIEACQQIKRDPRMRDVPVIMVTGVVDVEFLSQAFMAGAIDYVTKPVEQVQLVARARSALRLKEELDRRKAGEQMLRQRERELQDREAELMSLTDRLRSAHQQIREVTALDDDTGLNRRGLLDRQLDWHWRRPDAEPIGLLAVTVDGYADHILQVGADAAAMVLGDIARVLRDAQARAGDMLVRMDEFAFALLAPGIDRPLMESLGDGLLETVREADLTWPLPGGAASPVTISVGMCWTMPATERPPRGLIDAALAASLNASGAGGDRVQEASAPG